jgi:hypothetical protein
VVSVPSDVIYAKEGETTTLNVAVSEPEGEDMTIRLSGTSEMVRIQEVTADNEEVEVTVNTDNTISVIGATSVVNIQLALSPTYGTAGNYNFNVEATDKAGHAGNGVVRYYVEHVNRAPEALQPLPVVVALNGTSGIVSINDLFTDPDGDEMTFTYSLSESGVVSVFQSGNDLIFVGQTLGTVVVTIVATDANGAQTTLHFNVEVRNTVGIADVDVESKVAVRPNPVVETLYVTLAADCESVTYAIFDYSGRQVYVATDAATAGVAKTINVSSFPSGVYILKVATAEGTSVHRIVKK